MVELSTHAEVIKALGGWAAVAEKFEIGGGSVRMWLSRRAFPPKYHIAMSAALRKHGHTAPARLWGMREPEVV